MATFVRWLIKKGSGMMIIGHSKTGPIIFNVLLTVHRDIFVYRGADKSLAPPGKKQATATEDFDLHVSYL